MDVEAEDWCTAAAEIITQLNGEIYDNNSGIIL